MGGWRTLNSFDAYIGLRGIQGKEKLAELEWFRPKVITEITEVKPE
jgi:hypothetical protein